MSFIRERSLLDMLEERGYMPRKGKYEDGGGWPDWFDLTTPAGTLRVSAFGPAYGDRLEVHAFNVHMAGAWSVRFTTGVPDDIILATINAAEKELRQEAADVSVKS